MYSREEVSKIKQAFWTAFGKYMKPVLSADGEAVGWINYKTGVNGISFTMDADKKKATIAILLSHSDTAMQQLHYQHFQQLKHLLHESLEEEDWLWQPGITDEYGRKVSAIRKTCEGVNILRNEDWPQVISFFKPRIIALDAFWSMAKYGFEAISV